MEETKKTNWTAELKEVFNDFLGHRKELGHPVTKYAKKLLVKKVNKAVDEYDCQLAVSCIERSIESGWRSIFVNEYDIKQWKERNNLAPKSFNIDDYFKEKGTG